MAAAETVRILTFNLWVGNEPERRLARTIDAIDALNVDVLLLQEVRSSPTLRNTAEQIAEKLGFSEFAYASLTAASASEQQGVAIVSRTALHNHRITALPHPEGPLTYVLLSAWIERAGLKVALHTTHLRWRPQDGVQRRDQAQAVLNVMAEYGGNLQILGGDFNASADTPEVSLIRSHYTDAFAARHPGEPGITWAKRNPGTESAAKQHGLEQDRRIDFLFVGPTSKLGDPVQECDVVLDQPVRDNGKDLWLSDHFGVRARVQLPGSEPPVIA